MTKCFKKLRRKNMIKKKYLISVHDMVFYDGMVPKMINESSKYQDEKLTHTSWSIILNILDKIIIDKAVNSLATMTDFPFYEGDLVYTEFLSKDKLIKCFVETKNNIIEQVTCANDIPNDEDLLIPVLLMAVKIDPELNTLFKQIVDNYVSKNINAELILEFCSKFYLKFGRNDQLIVYEPNGDVDTFIKSLYKKSFLNDNEDLANIEGKPELIIIKRPEEADDMLLRIANNTISFKSCWGCKHIINRLYSCNNGCCCEFCSRRIQTKDNFKRSDTNYKMNT